MTPLAVGIVLPVHDEAELLPAALGALDRARQALGPRNLPCYTVIVLDACTDRSASIARQWGDRLGPDAAGVVAIEARNVGLARRRGVDVVLGHFRAVPAYRLWLATTDADSEVPPTWLSDQLAHYEHGADLWTGRVEVVDWTERTTAVAQRWRRDYAAEVRPVHGASLGVRASAYLAVGGFAPLRTGEDQALHDAVLATGTLVGHGGGVPVNTSARRTARAPLGFAHALSTVDRADDDALAVGMAADAPVTSPVIRTPQPH
jgi:glycosyltransferase involved in cell wall biosynthesis